MTTTTTNAGEAPRSSRGHLIGRVLLWIGIAALPIVFAWATLLKGFSNRSRWIAFGWMVLQILATVFGHSAPTTTTTTNKATPASAPTTAGDGTAPAVASDSGTKQALSTHPTPELTSAQVHARDVSEAKVFWKAIVEQTDACDKLAAYASRAASHSNVFGLYDNAKIAKSNCFIVSQNVKQIALPEHASDAVKSGLKDALDSTADAYSTKAVAYGKMADMANGGIAGMRPSEMAELKQMTALGQLGALQAVAKTADAFSKENVTMQEYSGVGGASPKRGRKRHGG